MPRLVKPDRSGKPRILESQDVKPMIVEYGATYMTVQANGIQSASKRYNDIIIPVINTNENHRIGHIQCSEM
jgi:hypothetical protein